MSSIFISYAKEDFQSAEEIFYFLKEEGFHPWMDKKNLLPGQNWKHVLEDKLRQVDFILVLISNTSVSKQGYVQREFKRALEYWEERPESDIYLIPVKIDECEVPTSLNKFHWIEYTSEDFKTKIREAITIQTNKQNTKQPVSKVNKSKFGIKRKGMFIIAAIMTCAALASIGFFPPTNSPAESTRTVAGEKEKVYNFIVDYFDNVNSQLQVENIFADHIDTFYTRSNLTRADITEIRKDNDEFLNPKHKINKQSLAFVYEKNGIQYWSFFSRFVCYRKSKNKFEVANVFMEFGINKDFKITSIKEKVLDYKFTKSKPAI